MKAETRTRKSIPMTLTFHFLNIFKQAPGLRPGPPHPLPGTLGGPWGLGGPPWGGGAKKIFLTQNPHLWHYLHFWFRTPLLPSTWPFQNNNKCEWPIYAYKYRWPFYVHVIHCVIRSVRTCTLFASLCLRMRMWRHHVPVVTLRTLRYLLLTFSWCGFCILIRGYVYPT